MPTPIVMPRLGMTMTEGTVVEWPLEEGAAVTKGDLVLVIESDKSEIEIEAAGSGTLGPVFVEPEEEVPCGTLLGVIVAEEDEDFEADSFREQWQRENPVEEATSPTPDTPPPAPASSSKGKASRGSGPVTPAARKLARELGVDTATLVGSGPGGRITREDVEGAASRREGLRGVSDGVGLEVHVEGEGPPLFLLPGFGTDISSLSSQMPGLLERFAVHAVNPRGVGQSDAPDLEAYDVAVSAADVASLIEDPAHIVATSLGAAVAIEIALTEPEKVASLSLLAPLVEVGPRLAAVTRGWCTLAGEGDFQGLAEMLLPWFFGAATLSDAKKSERILRGLPATLSAVSGPVLERTRAGMLAWSGTRGQDLGEITVPTLVVVAGDDLLTPGGEKVAAAIPEARIEIVAGAGHAVGLEAPDQVNAAIHNHLASVIAEAS